VPAPVDLIPTSFMANNGRPVLKVADHGNGIPSEVLDKIFIPFFSTKKSGSGIGLSLCKQIMKLHKGNIQVQSKDDEGTVSSYSFNKRPVGCLIIQIIQYSKINPFKLNNEIRTIHYPSRDDGRSPGVF
jgi:signal transduction histidine kinase